MKAITAKRSRDADGPDQADTSRRRAISMDTILESTTGERDWKALFEVSEENEATSTEERHALARGVRNRLLRVVHPDQATSPAMRDAFHAATVNINRLWEVAIASLAPPGLVHAPSEGEGKQFLSEPGGSLSMLAQATLGNPPAMLRRFGSDFYVGFGSLQTLKGCRFLPMSTNRCISQDVVAQRVSENLARLREVGEYYDFGQISLVAVATPSSEQFVAEDPAEALEIPSTALVTSCSRGTSDAGGGGSVGSGNRFARFYVLDGQHRLSTMIELARERPNVPIWFALSVRVVPDKASANAALLHMQQTYRADPKCFFTADEEAEVAARTLDLARLAWPGAFDSTSTALSSFARPPRPTIRPKLDDGLFFDVLRDTHLLAEVIRAQTLADGSPLHAAGRPAVLFDALKAANDAIWQDAERRRASGDVAAKTFADCRDRFKGCFLGLYRRDKAGAALIEMLKTKQLCPGSAHCPLDD